MYTCVIPAPQSSDVRATGEQGGGEVEALELREVLIHLELFMAEGDVIPRLRPSAQMYGQRRTASGFAGADIPRRSS